MAEIGLFVDDADRRILRILQENNQLTLQQIADEAALSPSAVRRRVKRLRDSNVIEADVSLISPRFQGVEVIVTVTMQEESTSSYRAFRDRSLASDAVSQCYTVTGEADFILHVCMPNLESYEKWIEENILADAAVRRCVSNVVYSRVKFTTAIPL